MTKAEAMQIELMRQAGPHRRSELAFRLTEEVMELSRRAIARNFPELDDQQRGLKFIELHYGADLAARVEKWLAAHGKRLG